MKDDKNGWVNLDRFMYKRDQIGYRRRKKYFSVERQDTRMVLLFLIQFNYLVKLFSSVNFVFFCEAAPTSFRIHPSTILFQSSVK